MVAYRCLKVVYSERGEWKARSVAYICLKVGVYFLETEV